MRITRKAIALPGLLLAVGAFAATGIAASDPAAKSSATALAITASETGNQAPKGICSANFKHDASDRPASVQVDAHVMATWDATASEADARAALEKVADGQVRCEAGATAIGIPSGEAKAFELAEGELPEELKDLIPEDGGGFVVPGGPLGEDGATPVAPESFFEAIPEGETPEELKDLISKDGEGFVVPADGDLLDLVGEPAGVVVAEINPEKLGVAPADGVDVVGFVDAFYEKDADAEAARDIVRDLSGNEPEEISGDAILSEIVVGDCPKHDADGATPAPEAR